MVSDDVTTAKGRATRGRIVAAAAELMHRHGVAGTSTPAVRDAAFYEAQTQRLKALKRMRDEGVLSDAEYTAKRDAILKTL